MTTTELRMCRAIEAHLGCDPILPASLADHALLATLRLDSLDHVELLICLEEEFGVEVGDDEADAFVPRDGRAIKPLSELVTLINERIGAKVAA